MEVFKISKDNERARSLFETAKDRLEVVKLVYGRTYKVVEEYYEVIKELLNSLMYIDGFKTLSHKSLINYFSENYNELEDSQIRIIDVLRRSRNGIVYYGEKISKDFLINNEEDIKEIIRVLIKLVEGKLNE